MGIVTTDNKHYSAIANAIRDNKGEAETYTPAQMAEEINNACAAQHEIGYSEGLQAGHFIQRGMFTLAEDSNSIVLDIPSGIKMMEIVPQGTPAVGTSTRVPVCYLFASETFQNNVAYPEKGVTVQYNYNNNGYRTSFFKYDITDGFSVILNDILVFEAGMPYLWTAHYWQE